MPSRQTHEPPWSTIDSPETIDNTWAAVATAGFCPTLGSKAASPSTPLPITAVIVCVCSVSALGHRHEPHGFRPRGFCRLCGCPLHRMVGSEVAVAQRPVPDGVAVVAAIAHPLPVQAPLRWD